MCDNGNTSILTFMIVFGTVLYRTARVKLLHTFLLSGGSSGRLTKGDELIEIEFRRGAASAEDFLPSESISP